MFVKARLAPARCVTNTEGSVLLLNHNAAQAWRHEKDKLHETRREQVEAHSIATSTTKSTVAVGADDLAKRTLRWQREREEALKVSVQHTRILLEVVPLQDSGDHMASAHNV